MVANKNQTNKNKSVVGNVTYCLPGISCCNKGKQSLSVNKSLITLLIRWAHSNGNRCSVCLQSGLAQKYI